MWITHTQTELPLHKELPPADDLPWTINWVIRKRTQLDGYLELPKEKRPPDDIIWYGTSDDIEHWFDRVFDRDKPPIDKEVTLQIDPKEIE